MSFIYLEQYFVNTYMYMKSYTEILVRENSIPFLYFYRYALYWLTFFLRLFQTIWTTHRWRYSSIERAVVNLQMPADESGLWKGKTLTFRFCGIRSNVYKSSHYWCDICGCPRSLCLPTTSLLLILLCIYNMIYYIESIFT